MKVMDIGEAMHDDICDIEATQKGNNSAANDAAGEADDVAADWLDTACRNELEILADFLEKGWQRRVFDGNEHTGFGAHLTRKKINRIEVTLSQFVAFRSDCMGEGKNRI